MTFTILNERSDTTLNTNTITAEHRNAVCIEYTSVTHPRNGTKTKKMPLRKKLMMESTVALLSDDMSF